MDAMQEPANDALKTIVDNIQGLGLGLAVNKTQAVVFTKRYGAARFPNENSVRALKKKVCCVIIINT